MPLNQPSNQGPLLQTIPPNEAPVAFEPPGLPSVEQFEPVKRDVDFGKETIEGRLPGILESESPLMKRAAYEGEAFANKRGLLDSSIAAEASQAAMLDRAMPIAAQDAQTYAQRAGQELDIAATGAGREQTQAYQLQQQQQASDLNAQMMELEAGINERLYGVQQEYAVQLETLRNTFEIQKNLDTQMGSIYADGLKSISNLLDDPRMSAEQQEVGLNTIIDNMQAGLDFLAGISSTAGAVSPYGDTVAQADTSPMVDKERVDALDSQIADLEKQLGLVEMDLSQVEDPGGQHLTIKQRDELKAQIEALKKERGAA